ncbi:MAG: hypothetical protein HZA20_07145 [Nitrospirae bacterium]|nr:hypothetical protein [Nitrospirota bacterium]
MSNSIYERFVWFDAEARKNRYPNAPALAERFEICVRTARRKFFLSRISEAELLAPEALRLDVASEARKTAEVYGGKRKTRKENEKGDDPGHGMSGVGE